MTKTRSARPLLFLSMAAALALPAVTEAATVDRYNLTCTPLSNTFTGTNTFDETLTAEQYQGVVDETKVFAIDLVAGTSCNPDYCTEGSFGGPEPIAAITPAQILFSEIAAREVPSNDYNVMSYREAYDRKTQTLTVTFGFFAEDLTTPKGSFTLTKACTITNYKIGG